MSSRERARFLVETLQLPQPLQLADIGARLTKDTPPYQPLLDHGAAHLHGFEPDPEAFEALRAAATERMSVYPYAVGTPGPATFYSHHIGSISSVFPLAPASAKFLGKGFWLNRPITEIEMELVALDAVAGLPDLDILKMDVQGSELGVLQHGRERLARCVMIIPEVRFYPMYEGEPTWADLDAEMRAQGFVLHRFLHQKSVVVRSSQKSEFRRGAGSQLLDGDAVYIRAAHDPDALDDRQLKALALAADVMAQSHDLCAYCLDALRARGQVDRKAIKSYIRQLPRGVLAGSN